MAILNIFSPGWVVGGSTTQHVANPWATKAKPTTDVWVQCTMGAIQINDTISLAGFGIIEIEFLDGNGHFQRKTFGDVGNLDNVIPEDLPPRLFVSNMLSVTLALVTYDTGASGTVTLFEWG